MTLLRLFSLTALIFSNYVPYVHAMRVNFAKSITITQSLHVASQKGLKEEVLQHLRNGALVNEYDNQGFTPLHIAAREGHLPVVITLIEKGAKAYLPDLKGASALHLAAQNGHLSVVEVLIKQLPNKIDICSNDNETPLCYAARGGFIDSMQALISAGASITAIGSEPLICVAMTSNNVQVIKMLFEQYLDIRTCFPSCCWGFKTSLHFAVMLGNPDVVRSC